MGIPLKYNHPVILIGGGIVEENALRAAEMLSRTYIAADGGADKARGRPIEAIIGDLDSLADQEEWAARDVPILHDKDQNSTDFDKCLSRIEAPLILAVGFTGGRIDHTLAVMGRLGRGDAGHVIVVGDEDVVCLCPPKIALPLAADTRVSLYPLGACCGVRSRGLRWPIDGLEMEMTGQIGTSNVATGPIEIAMSGPCLLILPQETLPVLAACLARKD